MVIFQTYVSLPEGTGWPVLLEVGKKWSLVSADSSKSTYSIIHLKTWSRERCWHSPSTTFRHPPDQFCAQNQAQTHRTLQTQSQGLSAVWLMVPKDFFGAPYDPWHMSSQESNREVPASQGLVGWVNWLSPISIVNSSRLFWGKATGDPYFHGILKNAAGFWRSSKKQIEYPLVMTNIANWKITMLLMGKSTINGHFQ